MLSSGPDAPAAPPAPAAPVVVDNSAIMEKLATISAQQQQTINMITTEATETVRGNRAHPCIRYNEDYGAGCATDASCGYADVVGIVSPTCQVRSCRV